MNQIKNKPDSEESSNSVVYSRGLELARGDGKISSEHQKLFDQFDDHE